ncbi:MAG TPA: hypothetical protein VMF90_09870 [Rhizobiaceae bacterium]|nr:hypothetical protein [Rhizobiaceae bacterium]
MLRELSEDVRIRVKDRLRDFRQVVRQHRHDSVSSRSADEKDQPFPIREIEGFLGHAASAFDDVMSLAEHLAPRESFGLREVTGPRPLQAYFRAEKDAQVDGARAFRRNLYRLAKLVLEKKQLSGFLIREVDFAAVHASLQKQNAAQIADIHNGAAGDERVALVAALTASLFVELAKRQPIHMAPPAEENAIDIGADAATNALAAIAIACGLATLDMEGAADPELMEIAVLAVDARADRIHAALKSTDPAKMLTPLFASLLTHLN